MGGLEDLDYLRIPADDNNQYQHTVDWNGEHRKI
jgi:hypothetical protein